MPGIPAATMRSGATAPCATSQPRACSVRARPSSPPMSRPSCQRAAVAGPDVPSPSYSAVARRSDVMARSSSPSKCASTAANECSEPTRAGSGDAAIILIRRRTCVMCARNADGSRRRTSAARATVHAPTQIETSSRTAGTFQSMLRSMRRRPSSIHAASASARPAYSASITRERHPQ